MINKLKTKTQWKEETKETQKKVNKGRIRKMQKKAEMQYSKAILNLLKGDEKNLKIPLSSHIQIIRPKRV